MRFVLAGVSGFLGTAWRDHLAREGHEVVRLVRGVALSASESRWDPYGGHVDLELVESADVVGALSGAPLAHWPWTASYKRTFTESRVATTRTLAEAVAASERRPAFVAQNGIAGYGDRGDAPLTEESAFDADTFMGRVTRTWQDATTAAVEAGARTVVMRSGVVLDRHGGAMKPLLPLFKAGLAGRSATGRSTSPRSRCGTGSGRPRTWRSMTAPPGSTTCRRPTRRPMRSSASSSAGCCTARRC